MNKVIIAINKEGWDITINDESQTLTEKHLIKGNKVKRIKGDFFKEKSISNDLHDSLDELDLFYVSDSLR